VEATLLSLFLVNPSPNKATGVSLPRAWGGRASHKGSRRKKLYARRRRVDSETRI